MKSSFGALLIGIVVIALACLYVSQSTSLPYNVRELIDPQSPLISSVGLSLALFWCFGVPVGIALYCMGRSSISVKAISLGILYLVHCIVAWGLLSAAVPLESMYDIVGAPVLDWPWKWELLGRFIAFFGVFSLLSCAAAMVSIRQYQVCRAGVVHYAPLVGAVLLVLIGSYWIVISAAATDNITELLMSGGGVQTVIFMSVALFFWVYAGCGLSILLTRGARRMNPLQLVMIIVALPCVYIGLSLSLEPQVHKYGQVFSALQFLLSVDRGDFVQGTDLITRLAVSYAALVALFAIAQYPFWRYAFHGHRDRNAIINRNLL